MKTVLPIDAATDLATLLRGLLAARPFVRFRVVTARGDDFKVGEPDHAMVSPSNATLIVYDMRGDAHHVALNAITAIRIGSAKKAAKRAAKRATASA